MHSIKETLEHRAAHDREGSNRGTRIGTRDQLQDALDGKSTLESHTAAQIEQLMTEKAAIETRASALADQLQDALDGKSTLESHTAAQIEQLMTEKAAIETRASALADQLQDALDGKSTLESHTAAQIEQLMTEKAAIEARASALADQLQDALDGKSTLESHTAAQIEQLMTEKAAIETRASALADQLQDALDGKSTLESHTAAQIEQLMTEKAAIEHAHRHLRTNCKMHWMATIETRASALADQLQDALDGKSTLESHTAAQIEQLMTEKAAIETRASALADQLQDALDGKSTLESHTAAQIEQLMTEKAAIETRASALADQLQDALDGKSTLESHTAAQIEQLMTEKAAIETRASALADQLQMHWMASRHSSHTRPRRLTAHDREGGNRDTRIGTCGPTAGRTGWQIEQLMTEKAAIETRASALADQLQDALDGKSTLESHTAAQIEQLMTEKAAIETRASALADQLQDALDGKSTLESHTAAQIEQLMTEKAAIETRASALADQLECLSHLPQLVLDTRDSFEKHIDVLESALAALMSRAASSEARCASYLSQLKHRLEVDSNHGHTVKSLRATIDNLKHQLSISKKDASELYSKRTQVESELVAVAQSNSRLKEKLQIQFTDYQHLERDYQSLCKDYSVLQSTTTANAKEYAQQQDQYARVVSELKQFKVEAAKIQSNNVEATSRLSCALKELEECNAKVAERERMLKAMRQECDELQERCVQLEMTQLENKARVRELEQSLATARERAGQLDILLEDERAENEVKSRQYSDDQSRAIEERARQQKRIDELVREIDSIRDRSQQELQARQEKWERDAAELNSELEACRQELANVGVKGQAACAALEAIEERLCAAGQITLDDLGAIVSTTQQSEKNRDKENQYLRQRICRLEKEFAEQALTIDDLRSRLHRSLSELQQQQPSMAEHMPYTASSEDEPSELAIGILETLPKSRESSAHAKVEHDSFADQLGLANHKAEIMEKLVADFRKRLNTSQMFLAEEKTKRRQMEDRVLHLETMLSVANARLEDIKSASAHAEPATAQQSHSSLARARMMQGALPDQRPAVSAAGQRERASALSIQPSSASNISKVAAADNDIGGSAAPLALTAQSDVLSQAKPRQSQPSDLIGSGGVAASAPTTMPRHRRTRATAQDKENSAPKGRGKQGDAADPSGIQPECNQQ
ncbi:hypothetical protein BC831DRAFT_502666 [Entophlyctis helioformis]|nr:hypothetical protein BC831DRAFT_502666 [Entophlyctis helioformis]